MALIKCPECGKTVSDLASECIHCGYPLNKDKLVSISDSLAPVSSEVEIEAYDVMLVDYGDSKLKTANNLKKLLDITYTQAYNLLATLPVYIFNDIPQNDAEYIARKLMNMNMRVAVYDPIGNVRYYEPPVYINRPLPVVAPMPRIRRLVKPSPIIHYRPTPVISPFTYYNSRPKGGPGKTQPRINININTDPSPKKTIKTSPKKTITQRPAAPSMPKSSGPSFTKTLTRTTGSSSSSQRSSGSRSIGGRISSSNSRGKR
ncbi:MAG: zinc ribbon domain-containing protein [Erysipelotrichaceae bacterium]|nr:zinc ribbon domain-containing protein [Erysipelotrichaceae bacterium]